jgi:hypothetical protein
MAQVKVPKSVKEQIAADEEVIGKLSINADYYATNKRLLFFKRSEAWIAFFGLWGLLAQKKYGGDIEYSKISDITLKKHRPKPQFIAGLIIGVPLLISSLWFFSLPETAPIGVIALVLALFALIALCIPKRTYYQIEGSTLSEKDMKKWRLPRFRAGGKRVDQFVEIIKERAGK